MSHLTSLAGRLLAALRYPRPILAVANRSSNSLNINRSSGVSIGPGNHIRGTVDLGPDVTIGPNNRIHGDITFGEGCRIKQENTIIGTADFRSASFIGPRNTIKGTVEVGSRGLITRGSMIDGKVDIGRYTTIRTGELRGKVQMGQFCMLAAEVVLQQREHDISKPAVQERLYGETLDGKKEKLGKGAIEIGNDVWLGRRSTVMSGVTVGHGAVIGAGAVVTEDVEPYAIVAGVPAERIGWRFPPAVREALLELEWWDWSESELRENESFFRTDAPEYFAEATGTT